MLLYEAMKAGGLTQEVHTENKVKDRTLGHPQMQETRRENRQREEWELSV